MDAKRGIPVPASSRALYRTADCRPTTFVRFLQRRVGCPAFPASSPEVAHPFDLLPATERAPTHWTGRFRSSSSARAMSIRSAFHRLVELARNVRSSQRVPSPEKACAQRDERIQFGQVARLPTLRDTRDSLLRLERCDLRKRLRTGHYRGGRFLPEFALS